MWLCRTSEKYLSGMTFFKDNGQAFCAVPGQLDRPDRAEAVPLMDYIKTALGLGERPECEGPDGVGRRGFEEKGPAVELRACSSQELDLVGESHEVPLRSIDHSERPAGQVLDLDRDLEDAKSSNHQ